MKQVGEVIGVSPFAVANWESGKTSPTQATSPGIVRFLGFNPLPQASLSERIHAIRFGMGWTQEDAAKACGVSEDSWCAWEQGANPIRQKAAKLEALLLEARSSIST